MKCETQTLRNNRTLYFDFLRIFATLGVIIIHVSSQNWYTASVLSLEWQTSNFFDSITRWSVPIFVMISGALFLDGNRSIKKIFQKNILRIVTSFIFWSVLYAFISYLQGSSGSSTLKKALNGHYHMWFLFMIVGLYLIVPFVKRIVESKTLTKYFLILGLIFTVIIPDVMTVLNLLNATASDIADSVLKNINFHFTLGYVFYFVLGYYINKKEFSKKARHIIYALSVLGFISTLVGSSLVSTYTNEANAHFFRYLSLNVMLESLGLFVFFKYNVNPININKKIQSIIIKLSKYSFGAYLVHALIIEQLDKLFGFNTMSFNPILANIVIILITFVLSYAISYICNHIPLLNKYIV